MPGCFDEVDTMAVIGRMNSLQVVKHTDFGLYLDGGADGEILLPKRYIPKDTPSEVEDWLNVFIYLDSEDKLIATTLKPKIQLGEFASLKVVDINRVGLFFDWGLPKDLLLPHSEEKRPLQIGDYCVVYLYLDKRTRRLTATARLDRHLDKVPANYQVGQEVDLLVVERTDLGFKAIIDGKHWGLIHKNELFKFIRSGMREKGYIKELRADGKISLSLQPIGHEAASGLAEQIIERLRDQGGVLALGDKSPPELIAEQFRVSKGNFKKAIGGLYKQGLIRIHDDRIELLDN
jgi:predicted RNA-binding protein (virulence factor B family)